MVTPVFKTDPPVPPEPAARPLAEKKEISYITATARICTRCSELWAKTPPDWKNSKSIPPRTTPDPKDVIHWTFLDFRTPWEIEFKVCKTRYAYRILHEGDFTVKFDGSRIFITREGACKSCTKNKE